MKAGDSFINPRKMKVIITFTICCLLGVNAYTPETKIIGGQEATLGQFPFIVSLQDSNSRSHFCGGCLISQRIVITAGHCFQGNTDPDASVVFAGSNDLGKGGTYYDLSRVVVHQRFNPNTLKNDITLLQTKTAVQLGPNVGTLKLPTQGQNIPAGTTVTALGWGTIRYPNQNYPDILHYVPLGVVSNGDCQTRLQDSISSTQICVGGENGQGLCFGDSGSPLVLNGDTTVGIVSWGQPCGVGYPDVFTRTSEFVDWIATTSAALEALDS